jgi:hypothetical protein
MDDDHLLSGSHRETGLLRQSKFLDYDLVFQLNIQ